MSLRINNNIPALNSLRNLDETNKKLSQSLERLSSGFKINRGADSPAGLVISEQMKAQLAAVNQAIANSELDNAMIQTTEGALTEVNNLLIRMRQLSLQAANESANDEASLEAIQVEINNGLSSLARLAESAQFGKKKLLDGSTGVSGESQGQGLTFIGATVDTKTSPIEGYVVDIERSASRAFLQGSTPITQANLPGLDVTLFAGGKTVKVAPAEGDTPISFFGKLQSLVQRAGLPIDLDLSPDGVLAVVHRDFGSESTFQAVSSVAGVISEQAGIAQDAIPGQDVAGTVAGEAAVGRGQVLTGIEGNENTDGLRVRYSGRDIGPVGTVNVANNALRFQIVPDATQKTVIALPTVSPQFLSRSVENQSGFTSLADVNVRNSQGAADTIELIDSAIDELNLTRGRLGAFQRNEVERNIATLRVTVENLTAAGSAIRDANIADEVTEATKNRIKLQSNIAALAQANQVPSLVIDLIR
jgi:flagellin